MNLRRLARRDRGLKLLAGLIGGNADDVAKEVAIYKAHKATPIVIATEGDGRFAGASAVLTVPTVDPALAFVLFFELIATAGPVRATVITFLNPAVAILLGLVVLSEPLTWGTVVGFPLVLLGSYWATRPTTPVVATAASADETGVSKATLSGVLTTLEKRGLVARSKSPEDGRLVLVELTARGRRLITRLFPQINSEETLATRLLPPGRKEDTAELLRLMVLAVSDIDS